MADLTKNADGTPVRQVTIPSDAELDYTIFWGAEASAKQGRLARLGRSVTGSDKINLDAAVMLANAASKVVGAAHPLNKNALFGSAIYQEDTVAREGQLAEETVKIFLGQMHPDVRWATFAATCFGSLTGLANLSMLGFRLTDANTKTVYINTVRSIENEASAAIFGRLTRQPIGWSVTQTDDTVTIPRNIRDDKAKWRSLADSMRVALR